MVLVSASSYYSTLVVHMREVNGIPVAYSLCQMVPCISIFWNFFAATKDCSMPRVKYNVELIHEISF